MCCKTTSRMLQISVLLILLNLALCGNTQAGRVAFSVVPVSPLEGEMLELNCQDQSFNWWSKKDFTFYRNGKKIHSIQSRTAKSSYHIKVNSTNDSGWYSCKIDRSGSQYVHVQVKERFAKPGLRVEPAAEVIEGLQVTLMCIAEKARPSIRLRYTFYRDGSALEAASGDGGVYTINAAAANVSGNYACEAIETNYDPRKRSENVHLSVKESFAVPKLTVHPEGQLVDGQWFKLVCLVEENLSEASLRYGFYRNGIPLQSPSDHNDYVSEPARPADSGIYHCEVTGGKVRKHSNQLHLSIRGNSSTVSQPKRSRASGEGAAASNLEYAVTGAAHNAENTAADLVYSVVTIKKRADAGSSVGFSSNGKKDAKPDPDDYCVTYATLKLSERSEGEDRADGNDYENILLN